MKRELEEKLYTRFQKMFRGRYFSIKENLMAFGCECGNGWFQILWDMCEALERTDGSDKILFVQIKEKFGSLRVYADGVTEAHQAIIDKSEKLSAKTCESCGAKGKIVEKGGWYYARCKPCWEKFNAKEEE